MKKLFLLMMLYVLGGCAYSFEVVRNDDTQIVDGRFTDEHEALEYVNRYKEHHDYKIVKIISN